SSWSGRPASHGDELLVGVIAHEVAHMILKHKYRDGIFGNLEPRVSGQTVSELEQILLDYKYHSELVGEYFSPELAGLPISGDLGGKFKKYVSELRDHADQTGNTCGAIAEDRYTQLREDIVGQIDPISYRYISKNSSSIEIESFIAGLRSCADSVSFQGIEINIWTTLMANGRKTMFPTVMERLLGKTFDYENEHEIDIMIEVTKEIRQMMASSFEQNQLGALNWDSVEDEADRLALVVLNEFGYEPNPYIFVTAAVAWAGMGEFSDNMDLCAHRINNAEEIPMGWPAIAHHAPCHRIHKKLKYYGLLQAQP
ncbi:MAG: hypothetical protein AAF202_10270, partial [Pseudomonadota bacterium]